jgi:hypothetical protein
MMRPAILLAAATAAHADTLRLGSAAGEPSSAVVLPVTLQKENPVVAVQFELKFPDNQLEVLPASVTAPGADHLASSADTAVGVTRIVIYSPTNTELPAALSIEIPLDLTAASPSGGPSIEIQNIIFTDAAGAQVSSAAAYTLAEEWRRAHFTPEERALAALIGDDADPDGDGLLNLYELAAGSSPRTPGASPPVPAVVAGAQRTLTLTFQRGQSAAAQNAVAVTPETSTDLTTWTTAGIVTAPTGAQTPDAVEMRASITATGDAERFLRLRIERTE